MHCCCISMQSFQVNSLVPQVNASVQKGSAEETGLFFLQHASSTLMSTILWGMLSIRNYFCISICHECSYVPTITTGYIVFIWSHKIVWMRMQADCLLTITFPIGVFSVASSVTSCLWCDSSCMEEQWPIKLGGSGSQHTKVNSWTFLYS